MIVVKIHVPACLYPAPTASPTTFALSSNICAMRPRSGSIAHSFSGTLWQTQAHPRNECQPHVMNMREQFSDRWAVCHRPTLSEPSGRVRSRPSRMVLLRSQESRIASSSDWSFGFDMDSNPSSDGIIFNEIVS